MVNQSVQVILNISKNTSDPFLKKKELLKIKDRKERSRKIALWACEYGFEEIHPAPMPICPSVLYDARRQVHVRQLQGKRAKIKQETLEKPEVELYFNMKWSAECENRANFEWLHELKNMLDTSDMLQRSKIHNRIREFEEFFEKQEKPFNALCLRK